MLPNVADAYTHTLLSPPYEFDTDTRWVTVEVGGGGHTLALRRWAPRVPDPRATAPP